MHNNYVATLLLSLHIVTCKIQFNLTCALHSAQLLLLPINITI